jgi:molybdate transport system substrate-binding protein
MSFAWSARASVALRPFAVGSLAVLWGLGCERESGSGASSGEGPRTLVVFAAASLHDAFSRLEHRFEASHPGVDVALSFAGSQELRTQLEHGARADVFASADPLSMDALLRQGLVVDAVTFAHNELVIVVSNECAVPVTGVVDLPNLSRIVLGAEQVPIGRYTAGVLERASELFGADFRARVDARVVSRELNVRQALSRVVQGEAEAAVVYRSDAVSAGDTVRVVNIPPEMNVSAEYPIARVVRSPEPTLAVQWIEGVRSREGQLQLIAAGLRPSVP